jgi:hypothetical protein
MTKDEQRPIVIPSKKIIKIKNTNSKQAILKQENLVDESTSRIHLLIKF